MVGPGLFPDDSDGGRPSVRMAVRDMASLLAHRLKTQMQQHLLQRLKVHDGKAVIRIPQPAAMLQNEVAPLFRPCIPPSTTPIPP